MHLQQGDIQLRIPLADVGTYYYWTQCWVYDLDNPPVSGNPSLYWIYTAYHLGTLGNVQTYHQQRIEPPYSGNVIAKFSAVGDFGTMVPYDQWSLFDCVRMNFYSAGRYVGYKRWRSPLRPSDIAGELLTGSALSFFQYSVAPILLTAKITSRYGELIDDVQVSPRVHQWQWRHGTKRRTRPVIEYP